MTTTQQGKFRRAHLPQEEFMRRTKTFCILFVVFMYCICKAILFIFAGLSLLSASSVFAIVVCEKAAQRSEVDGTQSRSVLTRLRRATCLSVHRKWGRMQGGAHAGRRFGVTPHQERTIVKSTRLCFYLKAVFTPALSVISGPSLLYLPLLALGHTFVLQLLCFLDCGLLSHSGNNCCDTWVPAIWIGLKVCLELDNTH